MNKLLIEAFNLIAIAGILCIPFLNVKAKGILTLLIIFIQIALSSVVTYSVFTNGTIEYSYGGSIVTGIIPVSIDSLSAWFMIIINFGFITGAWYGIHYMKAYIGKEGNINMHAIAFILLYTSLIDICLVQNGFVFLVFWEIMALSSFILIIFEHYKNQTIKAGINFLIQSHISILFLTIAFMMAKVKTGTFDFSAISLYTATEPAATGIGLLLFFFCGFAIKAGFVPFHTWLPQAHPAAPSHISGIMSGVIIKIGIYGILRMLMLVKTDMLTVGYTILGISVITGVYGVMLAIIQHNLKKLLAYHSIENIGIIGIGIGLGCLGIGYNSPILIATGFGGALLHTLNHSLFKSLLFYSAGNIYQAVHTMRIEALGGLIKKMPHSGYLFLIGSLAICGLPPFNGFVSEFLIYSGLFNGLLSNQFLFILFILFVILGLVLIGGLALMCFTKAFGIVFLGNPREPIDVKNDVDTRARNYPLYLIALVILLIGIFPVAFKYMLADIIGHYEPVHNYSTFNELSGIINNLMVIGWYSLGFILLTGLLFFIRHLVTSKRRLQYEETWGCGYVGDASKMQYTASSYIRTYRKLAEPILLIKKEKSSATGLYPQKIEQTTHPYDKAESWLIDKPISVTKRILNKFIFLQNGNIQVYILYGFIFIGFILLAPVIADKLMMLISFLNRL